VWSERAGADDRQTLDDFVLSAAASIGTIEWQGYRDVRYRPASYYVSFIPDRGERTIFVEPSEGYRPRPLWSSTFRHDQVSEQLDVTRVCESSPQQQCGLYNYSVALTTPFAAAADTRYWIMIQAESPTVVGWGWRKGTDDNRRSLTNLAGTTFNWDLAFALRP